MEDAITEKSGQVDQNFEEGAGASARDSELRGPDALPLPTVPFSDHSPVGDWPDGPKKTDVGAVVEQPRNVQRRVVQIVAQDEFGNDATVNFVLENEPDDEDRFFVRKVQ